MFAALLRLADAAYRAGTPVLSDSAFDALSRLVPNALPPLSGADALVSLDCPADPSDWLERHADQPLTVQLKADGVSVALVYEDGLFVHARLRSGKDCTAMALRAGALTDLPGRPVGRVVVRVEAIAPNTSRNACAAALRRGNADFRILLLAFDVTGLGITTQYKSIEWLRLAGFGTLACTKASTAAEVFALFTEFCNDRHLLAFACDGIVVKLDSKRLQQDLGACSRAPRWAISLKP
jgi:DNA ligase (NAD+)